MWIDLEPCPPTRGGGSEGERERERERERESRCSPLKVGRYFKVVLILVEMSVSKSQMQIHLDLRDDEETP
jgi:hypothetical protein